MSDIQLLFRFVYHLAIRGMLYTLLLSQRKDLETGGTSKTTPPKNAGPTNSSRAVLGRNMLGYRAEKGCRRYLT